MYIIGTFGQEKRWQLGVPSTYQHPLAPSDTLLDPTNITQLENRLERSSLIKFDTPATATTAATTEGNSDRHQEAGELSVESVVSVHESPKPEEGERDGGKEREKSSSVINLHVAELETNSTEV